jgi:hypothetical protein
MKVRVLALFAAFVMGWLIAIILGKLLGLLLIVGLGAAIYFVLYRREAATT